MTSHVLETGKKFLYIGDVMVLIHAGNVEHAVFIEQSDLTEVITTDTVLVILPQ